MLVLKGSNFLRIIYHRLLPLLYDFQPSNLRPTVSTKSTLISGLPANVIVIVNVTAILEKANAIRQEQGDLKLYELWSLKELFNMLHLFKYSWDVYGSFISS